MTNITDDKKEPADEPPRPKKRKARPAESSSPGGCKAVSNGPAADTVTANKTAKPNRRAKARSRQSSGRVRLPDKLLKLLNDESKPDVFWWMPDGNGFAYNTEKVQEQFLDVHFSGTKLSSFVQSLNRW